MGRVLKNHEAGLQMQGRAARWPGGSALNLRSKSTVQFALRGIAVAACLWGSQAWALGLGRLQVQSALGETLRAEIEVTSITAEEAASLRLRVAPPAVYRASGVDYNAALPGTSIQLVQRNGQQVLQVRSERAVLEPFVGLIVEATWASGQMVRDYTMLFDPPQARPAAATPAEAVAVVPPAPATSAPLAPPSTTPASAPAPLTAAPMADAPRVAAPTPAAVASRPRQGGDTVRVVWGDSLSRIASRTVPAQVSLDQMLVALFRANPQAFMGDNMNRLKAGSVLTVPSAAEASQVSPAEAREIILAHSADFDAYRRRLAQGVTAAPVDTPARRATGQVQAQVEDRRQGAATAPERLILSPGGVKPTSPEAQVSSETERKEASTRIAELSRNVDDLKQLQQRQGPAAPAAAGSAPTLSPPKVAVAPRLPASAPTPTPTPTASTPVAPIKPEEPVTQADSGGFLDSLRGNPLLLPAGGALVLLLGGLVLYRLRGKLRKPSSETSFLKSRPQPDSFFGASGGQRIDTREADASATGGASTMSYSLSQLDAIGDVDPVAEADVYLAYGRDLQAEEILKEAMRSNPERMAIRSKLLEVYAKRRDIKSFELLATQMFNLTRGEGEDWTKAQELGRSIDPDNPLYQPGGVPEGESGLAPQATEPLGAPTLPQTAPSQAPAFEPAADATLDGIDLDLDLGGDTPPRAVETTQPIAPQVAPDSEPKTVPVQQPASVSVDEQPQAGSPDKPTPPAKPDDSLDFDLDALPDAAQVPALAPAAEESGGASLLDFGTELPALADSSTDGPLARKLELAEEFRQIGDLEGARDLLDEVVSKADGALKAKALGMLEKLG
jgi:pilus assembly protein FimV